jgi:multidrug resistance efflux pump
MAERPATGVTTDETTRAGGDGANPPAPRAAGAPDAKYRLSPAPARPDQDLRPATPAAAHRHAPRPQLVVGLVLILAVAATVWWLSSTGWTLPWAQPVEQLTASGTLEADEILVGFEVAGRIVELVQEGQTVQADEVVARLDDALIQVQIMQATLAARQQLEIQAERYQLRSPITGIVTRVALHIGEVVSPGQTVVAVADLANLELTAYVLERDLGQVRVGQEVTVTADPFPERTFRGVVTSTNPRAEFTPRNVQTQADRLNLVFGVKIRVENPDLALKPGMPADVTFPLP